MSFMDAAKTGKSDLYISLVETEKILSLFEIKKKSKNSF